MKHREIVRVVSSQEAMEGAGVRIRRSLGTPGFDHHDPFLLLDEFKSEEATDYLAGFPDHPHRGFETVTYMLAGRMRHEDHKGNRGDLGPGSVQWMTAGRGIIHSEMPLQEDGLMWGFQLWVNLPAKDKMTEPRYQDIPAERIPEIETADGIRMRIIAGEAGGARGAVEGIATTPLYVDVGLPPARDFELAIPKEHNALAYVFEGEAMVGEEPVAAGELGVLSKDGGEAVRIRTGERTARLLLLAARPLEEPMARYGPFVMSTPGEIQQAFDDYRRGTFLA